jgi:hypothetical protein
MAIFGERANRSIRAGWDRAQPWLTPPPPPSAPSHAPPHMADAAPSAPGGAAAAAPTTAAPATVAPPPAQLYPAYPPQHQQPPVQHLQPLGPRAPMVVPFQNAGTLKVSGLAAEVNEYLLWMLFSTVGTVTNCKVNRDGHMRPTGEGVVDMSDRVTVSATMPDSVVLCLCVFNGLTRPVFRSPAQARKVIDALGGRDIYGSVMRIEAVAVKYGEKAGRSYHTDSTACATYEPAPRDLFGSDHGGHDRTPLPLRGQHRQRGG